MATGSVPGTPVTPEGDLSLARELLAGLVAIAPTNLEDPAHDRYEKPNYPRAADFLVRTARRFGLATRIYDPLVAVPAGAPTVRGPSPNVVIDLDVGAASRVLVLAHYDVVPVPTEQLGRWRSPPHVLTQRDDGRWYGRGANDDLGSGVVASLLALKHLAEDGGVRRNVRLLVCCDEETGGAGGIEAVKAHDEALPPGDPERFLVGDVALIPDGSEHATAGSSGVVFLDASFAGTTTLGATLDLGEELVGLHEIVRAHRSVYPSPDWPDHGAPEPVITGRATVTQFDFERDGAPSSNAGVARVHAESDATNQIAEAVTIVVDGEPAAAEALVTRFGELVSLPFRLSRTVRTAVPAVPGTVAIQLVGQSAHAGYGHRGHNPVPAALALLRAATARGWLPASVRGHASFAIDLRLVPEADLDAGRSEVIDRVRRWAAAHHPDARIDVPPGRSRGGYAVAPDDPNVVRMERLLRTVAGGGGIYGEYGGTDASSLADVRTPDGRPLPAVVFGSMDRASHIHEAEESVDPRLLLAISETIRRFVAEP